MRRGGDPVGSLESRVGRFERSKWRRRHLRLGFMPGMDFSRFTLLHRRNVVGASHRCGALSRDESKRIGTANRVDARAAPNTEPVFLFPNSWNFPFLSGKPESA